MDSSQANSFLTHLRFVQNDTRTKRTPRGGRIIPTKEQLSSVLHKPRHLPHCRRSPFRPIPHQSTCKEDENLPQNQYTSLLSIISWTMIVSPVNPWFKQLLWLNPGDIAQTTRFTDICHQGRFYHIGQRTDNGYAPRRTPSTGNFWSVLPSPFYRTHLEALFNQDPQLPFDIPSEIK